MTKQVNMQFKCPGCGNDVTVHADMDPIQLAPATRAQLQPKGNIFVYQISSDMITQFITAKAQALVPGVEVEVVPLYCEGRKRHRFEPHRSYASLRIAFSEDVLEKKDADEGWFGKIGSANGNARVEKSVFQAIIQRYQYNKKMIDELLGSYKRLEDVEEVLGMDETYINDLKKYTTPQFIATREKKPWIVFAAAADNVIRDMLTNPDTQKPIGRVQIQDVYQVSKTVVEFIVYVHPEELKLKENNHVRQILMGEEKAKR